jgi:ribosomal protein L11 methylase PrmA
MRESRFVVAGVELVIREQLLEEEDDEDAVDAFFFASESLAGSTGQKVWDSALLAVRFLEAHPEHVRGKQVVELGCGTGICGLAAAAVGASEVLVTDMPSVVAYCTAVNVDANPALNTVRCAPLDWLQFEASGGTSFDPALSFDTVLASDCVWLVELLPSFAYTMAQLLKRRGGSVGVVAQTERSRADSVVFASTAQLLLGLQRHGIVVEHATPNIFLLRLAEM